MDSSTQNSKLKENLIGDIENQKVDIDQREIETDIKKKFECGICYEEYDPEVTELKMLEECHHLFCADCFTENFRVLIEEENAHSKLKCPEYGCHVVPTQEDIKKTISENSWAKYLKFQQSTLVA